MDQIGRQELKSPQYQNEVKCSAFDMDLMQIKLNSTRKLVHLASFWKWGILSHRYNKIHWYFLLFCKSKHKKFPEIFASSEKQKQKQTNNNNNNNNKTTTTTKKYSSASDGAVQLLRYDPYCPIRAKIRTVDIQSDFRILLLLWLRKKNSSNAN